MHDKKLEYGLVFQPSWHFTQQIRLHNKKKSTTVEMAKSFEIHSSLFTCFCKSSVQGISRITDNPLSELSCIEKQMISTGLVTM